MKRTLLATLLSCSMPLLGATTSDTLIANLKKVADGRFANADIQVIRPLPAATLAGFYEVSIDGQPLIVHENGVDALIGDLYNLEQMVNLSEQYRLSRQADHAKKVIAMLAPENFVSYSPNGDKIGTVYVFSDPTCGYCRKLHSELQQYLDSQIEVKYIPYPRSGMVEGEQGYELVKQIMCAADPSAAMDEIKKGSAGDKYQQANYPQACLEVLHRGIVATEAIGLRGTPFIYLSNGSAIPGYQAAATIIEMLKSQGVR
ncbi:DsbC family protein [Ferrimonas senticii]|uniref:DsbC family protein n=1 Tax=Ferrimonas senticii TaxID=394566 RepID=UPI00146DFED4|nr:DsbC family protein [Ferrimonas senticii]